MSLELIPNEHQPIEVKSQAKGAREALWPELVQKDTHFGYLSSVGVMEETAPDNRPAVALKVRLEDGQIVVVALRADRFLGMAHAVRLAVDGFGPAPSPGGPAA